MAQPVVVPNSNDLSDAFSSILYNISDYGKRLADVSSIYASTLEDIDSRFFMSLDFLEYYKGYPRYPLDYKVIHNLGKYNLLAIYNIVQNDIKYLLDAIEDPGVLGLKGAMDKIPNKEIRQDYNLQSVYFSKISTDILPRNFYSGFSIDKTRRSYIYKTFGYYVPQENKESSLIYEYSLYVLLLRNLRNSLRIYESAFSTSNSIPIKNSDFSDSFKKYIEANKQILSEKLITYILEYTYKISDPSGSFLSKTVDNVSAKIGEISDVFSGSIKIKDNVCVNLVLRGSEYLYNHIAAKIANSAAGSEDLNLISKEMINSLKKFELVGDDSDDPINYKKITDKYSIQILRQYLYLVYYYKDYPRKFLNVLQLILSEYITQSMVDRNLTIFNATALLNQFRRVFGSTQSASSSGLDVKAVANLLTEVIDREYLISTIEEQKIAEYATRVELVYHIEEIFSLDNPEFEKYIDDLYDSIFKYLRNSVQIEPYYEYCFNKKMLHWYLIAYIKRDILQNKVFSREEERISNIYHETLNSEKYDPESEDYVVKFNDTRMRRRAIQYIEGNIVNIVNLFDNVIETAVEKKLHSENVSYYFS